MTYIAILVYLLAAYVVFLTVTVALFVIIVNLLYLSSRLKKRHVKYLGLIKEQVRNWYKQVLLYIPLSITAVVALIVLSFEPIHALHLRNQIKNASKVIVRSGSVYSKDREKENVYYETSDKNELQAIADKISLKSSLGFVCGCIGSISFDIYNDDKIITAFSVHHNKSIRIKSYRYGDINLTNSSSKKITEWLHEIGASSD